METSARATITVTITFTKSEAELLAAIVANGYPNIPKVETDFREELCTQLNMVLQAKICY